MRRILLASWAILFTTLGMWMGCSAEESNSTTGGNGAGAGGAGGTSTTTTTDPGCVGAADGECDPENEECDCPDCANTAVCIADLCTADGICDDMDSCICPDCDTDMVCADPTGENCVDDGSCDSYIEGCRCADCATKTECADNASVCAGGAPDGACAAPDEDCACSDCLGLAPCLPCVDDGECGSSDACFCPDCTADPWCTDAQNCLNDGVCAPLVEGCVCEDCAPLVACGGEPPDGGAGGGGGGTGGSSGGAP